MSKLTKWLSEEIPIRGVLGGGIPRGFHLATCLAFLSLIPLLYFKAAKNAPAYLKQDPIEWRRLDARAGTDDNGDYVMLEGKGGYIVGRRGDNGNFKLSRVEAYFGFSPKEELRPYTHPDSLGRAYREITERDDSN